MHASPPRAPLLAWLGGGAFVGSLVYFAWSFFDRFGRVPRDGPLVLASRVNLVLSGSSRSITACSRGAERSGGSYDACRLDSSVAVRLGRQSALRRGLCVLAGRPGRGSIVTAGLQAVPHWLAVGLGAWLTARSAQVIDPLDLAGIRQAKGVMTPARFRVIGPYHLVRHPIYLGWLLLVFGVPHMTAILAWRLP